MYLGPRTKSIQRESVFSSMIKVNHVETWTKGRYLSDCGVGWIFFEYDARLQLVAYSSPLPPWCLVELFSSHYSCGPVAVVMEDPGEGFPCNDQPLSGVDETQSPTSQPWCWVLSLWKANPMTINRVRSPSSYGRAYLWKKSSMIVIACFAGI